METTPRYPSPNQVGLSGGQSERATADDLTSGYEQVTPPLASPALLPDAPDRSLAGPGDFNRPNGSVGQNIPVDPNLAPSLNQDPGKTTFGPADFAGLPGATPDTQNIVTDPNAVGLTTPSSMTTDGPLSGELRTPGTPL